MGMIPELERRYPQDYDLTIMNTYYSYPQYVDGKKVADDFITLVYKNNNNGKKEAVNISKPVYTYYVLKEGEPEPDYNRLFIEKEKVTPVEVPFTKLERDIAERTGNLEFYQQNLINRDKQRNRELHTDPSIFFSDVSITDHYRFKFANTYKNDITKLYKGFFDIEVDGKFAAGEFTQLGECPINCVSFYDDKTDTSYTFILRDSRNPLIERFEEEVKSGKFGFKQIHNFVVDAVGGFKKATRYKVMNTKFKLFFFDFEIDLLRSLFATMHSCSPDFILGWNSSAFDISYIIERILVLGYDPVEIMCDQTWDPKYKMVKNFVDQRHLNEFAERGDYTIIAGLPTFMDQMIQYASRRKSQIGSFASFSLDSIGELEAGVKKLDYSYITDDVTELPWLDFKTFVLYNIMDVIVQKCIEVKTNDMEYIFSKCVLNNTSYNKGHRQTTYLINRMAANWYKKGYIIGNNVNKFNAEKRSFAGALVGDPTHLSEYCRMNVDNRAIWICDNLQDYDYKSLYPSIMGEFNIAPNTQIGNIKIESKVYDRENIVAEEEDKYSRSGEFIENLSSDNEIEYCHRWFKLANYEEFLQDVDEYYRLTSSIVIGLDDRDPLKPVTKDEPEEAIIFNRFTNNIYEDILVFHKDKPKDLTYQSIIINKGHYINGN